ETSLNFLSLAQNANNNSALIVTSTFMRAYITAQAVRVSGILSQLLVPNDCQSYGLHINCRLNGILYCLPVIAMLHPSPGLMNKVPVHAK
ncbi:hypothetical protein A2U01_0011844, partial [Trifolium medium]|nr:hypothetical protein [Trifolium medium]